MSNNQWHIDFKLNGYAFSSITELLEYSKSLSADTHQFLEDWFSESAVITVKTSGSTGKPKPIQLKKEFMINSAKATGNFFNLPQKTTALLCMPTAYIAGKMMLVRALVLGWHLDIITPSTSPLKELNKSYDFSAMVPLQLKNSLLEINKVKKLIVGGGVVSSELVKEIQQSKTEIFATYGMTETITHIAVKKLNHFEKKGILLEAHYQCLSDVVISVDDRNCLVINAPNVAEEQIITNDVVAFISDTEFKWLGRFDNVINSGGIKLHPEEIEKKLSKVITKRFFVTGISDENLGEKLVLIIELDVAFNEVDDYTKLYNNSIKTLKNLSKYEVPKQIYFVPNFIETETKKIQRSKTLDLIF